MASVLVLGGGVNGLTCALQLLKAGYNVEIWQAARGMAPPNWIWLYPAYHAEGSLDMSGLAKNTLESFQRLASNPDSHVHIIPVIVLGKDKLDANPGKDFLSNFKEGADALAEARRLLWGDQPTDRMYSDAQYYHAPVCDSVKYLGWLHKQIKALDGKIVKRTVSSMDEALREASAEVVVNCTGLGSQALAPDDKAYPCRGELIHVNAPWVNAAVFDNYDGDDGYVIPCPGCDLEIGGTSDKHAYERVLNPATKDTMLHNAISRIPSLKDAPVQDGWVGLRPNREGGIRLELEWCNTHDPYQRKAVIHNYGHGGAGMMLSYGCANQVVSLVKDVFADAGQHSKM